MPDTTAHTINRATDLMRRGQYAEALPMLRSVEADPRSWNALGVALYMTGAKAEAITCFRRAAQSGNSQAKDNLRQAEEIMEKSEKVKE